MILNFLSDITKDKENMLNDKSMTIDEKRKLLSVLFNCNKDSPKSSLKRKSSRKSKLYEKCYLENSLNPSEGNSSSDKFCSN